MKTSVKSFHKAFRFRDITNIIIKSLRCDSQLARNYEIVFSFFLILVRFVYLLIPQLFVFVV